MLQMKEFIEDYARISDVHFDVKLTFQLDPEQMHIVADSLTPFERVICQNAISAMNDQVNHNLSRDPWQARGAITAELLKDLEEIGELIEREMSR